MTSADATFIHTYSTGKTMASAVAINPQVQPSRFLQTTGDTTYGTTVTGMRVVKPRVHVHCVTPVTVLDQLPAWLAILS